MDILTAFAIGAANRGKPCKVFDWEKAARLIKERNPKKASAGLSEDWEYTAGTIYRDGEPVYDSYTYLASTWATPELEMDGETFDCYRMEDEGEWGASTKWPDEALRILSGND